ncbi:hypothetical protein [Roseateles sp. NT4]|uniref:hypothetical protein n=1 Tax=Roseateles sp. NT4 TaxID=3453715 RepID=UPI003F72474A
MDSKTRFLTTGRIASTLVGCVVSMGSLMVQATPANSLAQATESAPIATTQGGEGGRKGMSVICQLFGISCSKE